MYNLVIKKKKEGLHWWPVLLYINVPSQGHDVEWQRRQEVTFLLSDEMKSEAGNMEIVGPSRRLMLVMTGFFKWLYQ